MALRSLLEGRLDYAGLFPPAALGMPEAWRTFERHRGSEESWLTGSFVCPIGRLHELAPLPAAHAAPFALSLLLGGTAREMEEAEAAWESFRQGVATTVEIRAWELRLPRESAADPSPWLDRQCLLPGLAPRFWEAGADWTLAERDNLAFALAHHPGPAAMGLKLRCGGVSAEELPSVERLCQDLFLAARHALPLKLTAGLHHPLRHQRDGRPMHGFLNLYLAALAARLPHVDEAQLKALLEEEKASAFAVEGQRVRWRDLEWDAVILGGARAWVTGHGSCSVDEPVEDLKALGWWPASTAS
jgi:hypothetical protein